MSNSVYQKLTPLDEKQNIIPYKIVKCCTIINTFNTKVEEQDLDSFTKNIFKMFDVNNDRVLTFEEFTFATSAQNYDDPKEKLYWLFDNVYDKVNVIYENINCSLFHIYFEVRMKSALSLFHI